MHRQKIQIALDIGSRSIKAAAFDDREILVHKTCQLINGQLRGCLRGLLESLYFRFQGKDCVLMAITGANANFYADLLGLSPVNGILSTYQGVKRMVPEAGAILEIAGEHAKFIRLFPAENGEKVLKDFYVNSACSSGTGSFLEQEAHRLGLSLDEFSQLAARPARLARVAGRCAVFAKTDVVHLHQNGVPVADIAHSLCRSVAQNISNELMLSREFQPPLVFVGGVAANLGIQKALQSILNLDAESLIVPADYLFCGAIGSFLFLKSQNGARERALREAITKVEQGCEKRRKIITILKPLSPPVSMASRPLQTDERAWGKHTLDDTFIGIDIGSTSTNVVCISQAGEIYYKINLSTQGQPLNAVFYGLSFLREKLGSFRPKSLGITGSGRKLVAEIIGADAVLDEITAHALGGLHLLPEVDTILDIGGQDSKFIQIENGAVLNFSMNKVCSAGTGSFLEEMSELLGLKIEDEFAREAMRSTNPLDLGERCTVFMSTKLVGKLQEGEKREDLAAGLCYSAVKNYVSRVVGRNKIGRFISFQGGVASNPAVVSALENFLQKPIHVSEHHEIAGALGAALFASKQMKEPSRFRGFDNLDVHSVETRSFECQKCANNCSIHHTKDPSGNGYFSGGLCDRHEGRNLFLRHKKTDEIDLFEERDKFLNRSIKKPDSLQDRECIGIPRALHFYDLIPFWSTFFNEFQLDYRVSEPTSNKTVHKGITNCPTNPCLPVKTAYGHCIDLREKGIKKIFIPSISNLSFLTKKERMNHVCPASQAWPFTSRALFSEKIDFLTPTLRFGIPHYLKSDIVHFGRSLGYATQKTKKAFQKALEAQKEFYGLCQNLGRQIISDGLSEKTCAVILSRPYTVCDFTLRLHLKKIFNELNIVAIPLDMVDCEPKNSRELEGMYWYYGKRFLQAIDAMADRPEFAFIHLSNFACGADSFIIHFLRERLKNRPFLELEIDEHNQFTGMGTRLEAFIHSFQKKPAKRTSKPSPPHRIQTFDIKHQKLLIPQLSVHAFAFQASFRAFGVQAKVLPLPDVESVSYGKQSVGGGECLPCSFVIGDMLKYCKNHQERLSPPAFFMISGDGPCRLGQYPYLQRLVLDENGFGDALIFDASQDQSFYDRFGILPAAFKRRTWRGVVATDLLFRKWKETRPYVNDKERFDEVYWSEVEKICYHIRNSGNLVDQLKDSFEQLEKFPNAPLEAKPIVAVLGENYIRCNSVANGKIADLLEDLGAEVWFPSLYEWVYYGNWTARLHCLYEKQYKKYLNLYLIDAIQHWEEHKISKGIKGRLRNLDEPSLSENFRSASQYIPNTFEGETLIEVARTIDFHKKKVCGVIHVAPFGCIMGTIVETLSERISKNLSGFPIMTLYYDGLDYTSQISKLEGFMIRTRMWQGIKENK